MKERIQDKTMMVKPSDMEMLLFVRTNMKGKIPAVNVMTKLMAREVKEESIPFPQDTSMEISMNNALTSSDKPTFLAMTLTSILTISVKIQEK